MDDAVSAEGDGEYSLAKNRSKRSRVDKTSKFAALAKFKESKASGDKYKYMITEEKNIYEEVDESEYSELVRSRQDDDWIVDDGTGYVEDGREIFDDGEQDECEDVKAKQNKKRIKERSSKNPNIRPNDSKPSSIQSMFAAAATKPRKEAQVTSASLNDDEALGSIMSELTADSFRPSPVVIKKKSIQNPFGSGTTAVKSPAVFRSQPESCYRSSARESSFISRIEESSYKSITKESRCSAEVGRSQSNSRSRAEESSCRSSNAEVRAPVSRKPQRVREEVCPAPNSALDEFSEQMQGVSHWDDADEFSNGPTDCVSMEELMASESADMDVSGIDFDDDITAPSTGGEKVKNYIPAASTQRGIDSSQHSVSFSQADSGVLSDASMWADVTWEAVDGGVVDVDTTKLPLSSSEGGEETMRFFWLDASEDYFKQPGIVYLFGKVWIESAKTFVSCCVTVKNIERRLYFLPRKTRFNLKTNEGSDAPITALDVYNEFNEKIADKYKIMTFKSMKVTKSYAFEKDDVPAECEYLEVRYAASCGSLPMDLRGETFSHVFGTNTSSLETLLLDRKMKGPAWLDIRLPKPSSPPVSWCKVEVFVDDINQLMISSITAPPPPLVVMTMTLRTLYNSTQKQNEGITFCIENTSLQIVGVSCLVTKNFPIDKAAPKNAYQQHFCATSLPSGYVFPFDLKDKLQLKVSTMKVETMSNERALLGFLLCKIHQIDPDLLVGHDILGYDLDVLLHRLNHNRIPHWSRIGRLKRAVMPKFTGSVVSRTSMAVTGRLVADIMISAKELIRCRSYDLTEVTNQVLKEKRQEIDQDMIRTMFSASDDLIRLLESGLIDATYVLRIMCELNAIPLALQITNVCGNVMMRTLMGGRSERNEFLLLHAFTEKNFIVPDKQYGKKQLIIIEEDEDEGQNKKSGASKKKAAYTGGLVLEPKKGFYDQFILLLDFNSLYPSIIQEYNICFTTINVGSNAAGSDTLEYDDSLIPDASVEAGVLPTEIRKLVQSRRVVRQMMKAIDITPDQYTQYDIRQKALKLTANSMYGCLGFTFSRFYARRLAALVTGKGREILLKTRDLVLGMNLDVIYGDTDSIMINTGCTDIEQVFKIGNKVKAEVNKLYRLLEIDIDGVFQSMLLLKKKKYAALSVQKVGDKFVTSREMKGLDIVRRDWCPLAKEAGNYIVDQILSGQLRETIVESIHSKLIEVGQKVNNGEIPIELYYITKQLTKNTEDYPDKKNLPHVQVAMRLNSKGGRKLHSGDIVYYVICLDGSNLPATQRAYHPDELNKRDDLQIDTQYYLSQQVHPVVSRLCDPIDGTDAAHIAECLGLDPASYHHAIRQEADSDNALLSLIHASNEEKYKDCERFSFACVGCGQPHTVDSPLSDDTTRKSGVMWSLLKCANSDCNVVPLNDVSYLQNKLTLAIRTHIKKYYEGWLRCDDAGCGHTMRRFPVNFRNRQPVCPTCEKGSLLTEYTDRKLYLQLGFYQHLFDIDRALSLVNSVTEKERMKKCFNKAQTDGCWQLKCQVDEKMKQNAFSVVDLGCLFEGIVAPKPNGTVCV